MQRWEKNIRNYHFSAEEAAAITGISADRQRQWRVRYLDFSQAGWVMPNRGHWSWEGLQLLALFAQAFHDLRDALTARSVLRLDEEPGLTRDPIDIFRYDYRERRLFIVGDVGGGDLQRFSTCGSLSDVEHYQRLYAINFSLFQGGLVEKVTALVDVDAGPGALPKELRV